MTAAAPAGAPDRPAERPLDRRWLRRALALAAGAAAALAHPPFDLLPGLAGYALLMALTDRAGGARPRCSAFLTGWLAGAAYFTISLWWVAEAFYVDAENQGWMAPFAVVFLGAGLGLFWGAAAALYRALAAAGVRRVLLFAGVVALFEWLRGHVLTGLPWDLPGETWKAGSAPSQTAAVVGAYGLSWITLAAMASLSLVREGRKGLAVAAAGVLVVGGLYAFGAARLAQARPIAADAPRVRIVQADVRQESKYDERLFDDIVARYLALTATPAPRPPDIVVWPEGAIPAAFDDYLAPGAWTRRAIAGVIGPRQTLFVGGYRFARIAGQDVAYNSLMALRRDGDGLRTTALYDKYRLVPFGEFLPLERWIAPLGIKQLVHVGDGFTPGPRPRPIVSAGAPPAQPLICYESLFPGFTREGAIATGIAPVWIVNVSNDAWFGATSGPWQHLNIASYRAIEEGAPMVRATPTGISAMVDAYGRVRAGELLRHGVRGVIDAPLPPALPPTPYRKWGDAAFFGMLFASLAGLRLPRRATLRRNG